MSVYVCVCVCKGTCIVLYICVMESLQRGFTTNYGSKIYNCDVLNKIKEDL